jgi:hypothetical protein
VFYKYLAFGGIDVGPSMFQSVAAFDKESRENMTKTELQEAMSQLSIGDDKYDTSSPSALYAVDFEACMKAFLSRRAHAAFGFETREIVNMVTTTLERFMDYLLQHDVCPEYQNQVLAARDLCRKAESELWATAEAGRWLPGDFNVACSTLFDGQYARNYDGVTDWAPGKEGQAAFVGMTPDVAQQIMLFALAGAASEEVFRAFQRRDQADNFEERNQVVEIKHHAGFEITKIIEPTKECLKLYKEQSVDFRPVGRVYARPWQNPDAAPVDMTKEEREALEGRQSKGPAEEYTFFVESVILKNLYVGCKVEATIHKLNCGVWFFDDVVGTFPSFDTYLLNDMMEGYRESRWLEGSVEYERQEAAEAKQREEFEAAELAAAEAVKQEEVQTNKQEEVEAGEQEKVEG